MRFMIHILFLNDTIYILIPLKDFIYLNDPSIPYEELIILTHVYATTQRPPIIFFFTLL